MTEAFGVVVFAVVAIAAVVAVVTLAGSGRSYDEIGHGGLALRDGEDDFPAGPHAPAPPVSAAVRDEEIRQLVQARSDRRVRRGEAPLDVDAEVARLVGPAAPTVDPALRAEIRDMVVARNARLERAGKPLLDVDAEVERRVAELQG